MSIKIKLCIMTGNGEYIPVEIEKGHYSEFIKQVFDEYKVKRITKDMFYKGNVPVVKDVSMFSWLLELPDGESAYYCEGYEGVKANGEENYRLKMYNDKTYIDVYSRERKGIGGRVINDILNIGLKLDKFNEQDKINTGIITEDGFLSVEDILGYYILGVDKSERGKILVCEHDRCMVESTMHRNKCIELNIFKR